MRDHFAPTDDVHVHDERGNVIGRLIAVEVELDRPGHREVRCPPLTGVRRQDPAQPQGPADIERRGRNAAEAGSEQPEHVAAAPEGENPVDGREGGRTPSQPTLGGLGDYGAAPQAADVRADAPLAVWLHYVAVMKPRLGKGVDPADALDEDGRRIIRAALKAAALIEPDDAIGVCNRCIDTCAASDFHMGREAPHRYPGSRPRKYNKLGQIFKPKKVKGETQRDRLSWWLDKADEMSVPVSAATSADPARVQLEKRAVLDAHDFPGDEQMQERGGEAEQWLTENGWRVVRHPEGRPTFEVS